MADWLSPSIEKLVEKFIDIGSKYLQDQRRWQTGMKKELERLRENHPKIQAVVSAASQAQKLDPDSALNKWIWQLRDAIDEADDVLDDFEYMKHEQQLAINIKKTNERCCLSWFKKIGKRAFKSDPMLKRLEEVMHKLDKISAEFNTFLPLLKDTKEKQKVQQDKLQIFRETGPFPTTFPKEEQQDKLQNYQETGPFPITFPKEEQQDKLQNYQETGPFPTTFPKEEQLDKLQNYQETGTFPTDVLIGRGHEKEFIIQWLGKLPNEEHQSHVSNIPNYNNISLLSVVGLGGLGKTTLLQHVYGDEITNEFDLKIWVCVSNRFDVKKVIIEMLESLKMTTPFLESLDALQNHLKSEVMSKKFLLVLDDIWLENEEIDKIKWGNVLSPLAHGGLGSKILITTRMKSAASMIASVINKENGLLMMKGLDDNECLHLLNIHAFANVKKSNDHKKLESVARELVKNLYGNPLAAKVLGGALNSNLDERHWRNVLNNILDHNDISSILELSYILLPKYLQNCFAFCSIFAEDHVYDKDDLVRMWIAVDFIHPSCIRGETLEDIGERYFDILFKKYFFDKFDKGYKMHDLLHELAKSVSSQECFRIVGDEDSNLRILETIRHLSIETDNLALIKNMWKFKNLQTLCITYYRGGNQDLVDLFTKIFEESKRIRLLSIFAHDREMIPEEIGCLKHLRYLRLQFSTNSSFPRSVSNLYHLRFLISTCGASHDDLFPRDMNNLSNMRYLMSPHLNFPGIGKLKFLQELNEFVVKNDTGYRIEELEHMNDVCILGIKGLENVRDSEEARNAKLCDKRKLTDLTLEWEVNNQNIVDLDIYARVLDNLQPHKNLKKLTMKNYMGLRPAKWMNSADLITNLQHIDLAWCLEWQILPPFRHLPFIKSLKLRGMPKVKCLDNHRNDICGSFPSLEVLSIADLEALEDWFDVGDDCLFPRLTKLKLYNCQNLQELPYLPPKLEKLKAEKIGWKTLNCYSISKSVPLKKLQVLRCPNITDIIGRLAVIRIVEIVDCPNLISLGVHEEVETTENIPSSVERLQLSYESLQCQPFFSSIISSLTHLKLISIPLLKSLPYLPPTLCTIHLERLDKLDFLPSCFHNLSSLTSLSIWRVPQLQELPDLPPSLCRVLLDNLDSLNCLPSCLPSLSSLIQVDIDRVPQLRELPNLPLSLCKLKLINLDNLNCLPCCLPSLSSLTSLSIIRVPHLRELPDLPPSLCRLSLENLDNLNCLPLCLPTLSSLAYLSIRNIPLPRELFGLPPCLENFKISQCDPQLMKRCKEYYDFY